MTRRAYHPRRSTVELVRRIKALDGVASVDIHAPSHGLTIEPAFLIVTLTGRDGSGEPIRTNFSMAEARAWLALEEAKRPEDGAADPACDSRYWHHLGERCPTCGGIG